MHVHALQFDMAWEDKPANHSRVESLVSGRIRAGGLLALPEMADTGFSFNLDRTVDQTSAGWASGLARRLAATVQHGYAARGGDGRGRNVMGLFAPDGTLRGEYHKVHPFGYGKESQHFTGGSRLLLRRVAGAMLCPLICYDLRFPELWRLAAMAGAEVFTIGASWPSARQQHWRALTIARAIENQAYVVAVNRVGRDPTLSYVGGSLIVGPRGEVIAEAGDGEELLEAELDLSALRAWRAEFPALADMKKSLLGSIECDHERS